MSLLKPKQREAVYPLANLMVLCSKLSEYPRLFNLSIGHFKHDNEFKRIFQVPKLVEYLEAKRNQLDKQFTDDENELLDKEFYYYSGSMFTMKIICIEKNPILAEFLKLVYRLDDEQFKEFISLVVNQFSKREYERKLEEGYTNSKSGGFGFTISNSAFFPNSEGKDTYDGRTVLRTFALWEDHPYLEDQHSLLKEDFAKGVDVYLGDEVVGKVYELYMRLGKATAKITNRADYPLLTHPRLIDNCILIPHLEYKVVKEFRDQRGIDVKYLRPTIHKFTMYDKSKI
nr:MAG TPA: hypothetical protein [Caudoviricetes sp.]